MKKTLNELVNDPKYLKCNIKIGSKSGSSLWYCGKCKNFEKDLDKIRRKLLAQSKGTLYQLQFRQKHLDRLYEQLYKETIKKGKIKDTEKYYNNLMVKKERERLSLPKRIASIEYDIATPLLDRPVLEVVKGISPDEAPCWVVQVKGNERGCYWTIKEYEKGIKIYED